MSLTVCEMYQGRNVSTQSRVTRGLVSILGGSHSTPVNPGLHNTPVVLKFGLELKIPTHVTSNLATPYVGFIRTSVHA